MIRLMGAGTLLAAGVLLVGCASSDEQATSTSPSNTPSAPDAATQVPSQSASPSPSPTKAPPPTLLGNEATDALISTQDFKGYKALKGLALEGIGSKTVQMDSSGTIKPSACENVRSWLRSGSVSDPGLGETAYTFFVRQDPYAAVGQNITPSPAAESALAFVTQEAQDGCKTFVETSPAQLIINNGPANDVSEKEVLEVETSEVRGWPTTNVTYRVTYRSSASVTNGTAPVVYDVRVFSTAVGPNLVTTTADLQEGVGDVGELHEVTVSRVEEIMQAASEDGRSTEPDAYAGPAEGRSKSSTADDDDPTWPIDDIADEIAEQWQGSVVRSADIRKMVLLVCRETRDIPLMQPAQSTFIDLQNKIVTKFGLDRVTGSWNAWNLVTTAHARCQGASVTTSFS